MNAVLEHPVRRPIRELPSELVSQIAAGEVVERPASVVRELLDNAIDAGATSIAVRLSGGGIRSIAVEDDGHGIPAAELAAALRRHATSKIASLADLEGVATMGFRGEALAAIASVAAVALTSRSADAAHATTIDAQSGEVRPAARAIGTTVEVRELFFNTPARRKFLKSEATELAHCIEAVRRHALVRPDLAFAVWHDGKPVARWARASGGDRAAELLGAAFFEHSRAVEVDLGGLVVAGRTGTPESARARADLQYVYVNGRHVRDKLIAHAVRAAYDDVLHGGRQPAYLLFLAVAPERVDVNVHPAKVEVRFRDSREVHEAVRKAVAAALATAPGARAVHEGAPSSPVATLQNEATQGPLRWAERSPDAAVLRVAEAPAPPWHARDATPQPAPGEAQGWPLGRALAQVAGAFILAENEHGLVIVDMHAAHERIVYERLKTSLDAAEPAQQTLLIPTTFAASAAEIATAEAQVEALRALGLDLAPIGSATLALRSVPAALAGGDVVALARAVLAELAEVGTSEALVRARDPRPHAARDERLAARHGAHRSRRPVQPRPADLAPDHARRARPPVLARPMKPPPTPAQPASAAQAAPHADGSLRLSKRMSELGLASRREADEWIARGWVRVDGSVVSELGSRVLPSQRITIDPRARKAQAQLVTVLVHKPVGYVSGQAEDGYRPARMLVTPERQWRDDRSGIRFQPQHLKSLVPAGRLDIDSVGLLVLTQDGRVARQLIGEDSAIEKEYLVRVAPRDGAALSPQALALLRHGLSLDGATLRPAQVEWANADQLRFVLTEGKKRQIRRMCDAVGLQVLGLKRIRIGAVALGALPQGQWRYLRADERFEARAAAPPASAG